MLGVRRFTHTSNKTMKKEEEEHERRSFYFNRGTLTLMDRMADEDCRNVSNFIRVLVSNEACRRGLIEGGRLIESKCSAAGS